MFEKAIELKPTFALAYAGLGHVYGRMHRFYDQDPQWMTKGTQACERAIEIEPDLPEALSAQAFLFYSHEQYDMGARYGRKAIELKEDCEAGYYALGLCLFLSDRLQEVAALADRAIEVRKQLAEGKINILEAKGRLAGLELAGGDLDELAPAGVAVLALQKHRAIVEQRHHGDRAGVADVFASALCAVGKPNGIPVDLQQLTVEYQAAADEMLGQLRGL